LIQLTNSSEELKNGLIRLEWAYKNDSLLTKNVIYHAHVAFGRWEGAGGYIFSVFHAKNSYCPDYWEVGNEGYSFLYNYSICSMDGVNCFGGYNSY